MPYPMEAIIAKLSDAENVILQHELHTRDGLTRHFAMNEAAKLVQDWKWGATKNQIADAILRQAVYSAPDPPSDMVLALAALPRLADGATAYPGRMIWELCTIDSGKNWFPVQIAIGAIDCHKGMEILGSGSWIMNSDVRHYATREAALADIPNHVVKPSYEVVACTHHIDEWLAELIDPGEGEIFAARFTGPDSEERAREYAEWKNR